jgi:hypothetical protein
VAVGVTQPGGAGTDIFFQTDTSAPNGLYYTEADFAAAFPVDFVDLGTTPKSYRVKVNLRNGDGTLTDKTTWKGTRSSVFFDTGKTYLVSAVGITNRYTEFGLKATSASGEIMGYDGLTVFFGTNPTLQGNMKFYGSYLANVNGTAASSRVFILPAAAVTTELVDLDVFTQAGTQAFGTEAFPITLMRRVNAAGLGSALNGRIVQFNCQDADFISFYFPNGQTKVSTAGYVRIGNPQFIGPSSLGDSNCTVAGIFLNPIYSQNAPKLQSVGLPREDWFSFGVRVTDPDGNPIKGAKVDVWDDFDGRFVLEAEETGDLGTLDFLGPQSIAELGFGTDPDAPFRNALLVEGHNNDGLIHSHDPFKLTVRASGYADHLQLLTFPYEEYLAGAERQYFPLYLQVQMGNATADTIPIPAEPVIRIEAEAPTIT